MSFDDREFDDDDDLPQLPRRRTRRSRQHREHHDPSNPPLIGFIPFDLKSFWAMVFLPWIMRVLSVIGGMEEAWNGWLSFAMFTFGVAFAGWRLIQMRTPFIMYIVGFPFLISLVLMFLQLVAIWTSGRPMIAD